MGNKKASQAEQQSQQAFAQSQAEVAKIQPTAEAQAVSKDAYGDYQNLRTGDVSKNPLVYNYLQRAGAARRRADTMSPMGDASLASRIANPAFIAQNRDMLNRQAEQTDAQNVTGLAAQAENQAVSRVYGFSDASAGMAGQRAGAYRGLSNDAFGRYQYYKQQGTFWSNLGKTALTLGANIVTPGLGTFFSGALNGNGGGG